MAVEEKKRFFPVSMESKTRIGGAAAMGKPVAANHQQDQRNSIRIQRFIPNNKLFLSNQFLFFLHIIKYLEN